MIKVYTELNQILTLAGAHAKDGRHLVPADLSLIDSGAIAFDEEKILWIGPSDKLPAEYKSMAKSLAGYVLTPELVDAHTHIVFAGDRAQEYTDRLNGTSYETIAQRGGGILFTMRETQSTTPEELFKLASERILHLASYGVGTIEIKSGYGLSYQKEKELSLLIDRLKKHFAPKIQILNTYLAAHDVPRSFQNATSYLDEVVLPLLKELAALKILDAVDIFHEKNYFSDEDTARLFEEAKRLGVARKIHADELNTNGGTELAVGFEALSADHLLKVSDAGIKALAESSTVATLLPGTAFFLGKALAPSRKLLDQGAKVAIASDFNPGSCHCDNVLMIASIAAAQLKLNQAELWAAITLNAAHALGKIQQGALKPGLAPRFSLFHAPTLSHITYNWGHNLAVSLP
jgi:imidazolonepropionase